LPGHRWGTAREKKADDDGGNLPLDIATIAELSKQSRGAFIRKHEEAHASSHLAELPGALDDSADMKARLLVRESATFPC
jgi:hypothetical protein